ncbi:DUF4252 domain-containing protein [Marinicella rhabdoformis]|uniref:DUF4252 domain-containing protein n=1 Tax=Marinicella rhabdoformis TaxID=2580566 RepID=UPI0012AEC6BD|nr:DUF4252 domain-containing protein [Marinicella rhabdoformis]
MKKLLLMCLFLSFQTQAQDIMQQLQDMIKTEPNVEVNLGAGMLGLLSGMTQSEGEVADVMKNLTEIVVRVYELDDDFDGDITQIKSWVNDTAKGMKASGFQQLAAIREDDSTVFILAEMDKQTMKGLSVMALDDESELVVIKIGGQILLKDLGVLMDRFNVDISDIDIN